MEEQLPLDFGANFQPLNPHVGANYYVANYAWWVTVTEVTEEYMVCSVINGGWNFYYYFDEGAAYVLKREKYDPTSSCFYESWRQEPRDFKVSFEPYKY